MACCEDLTLFTIGGPEAAKLAKTATRITHTQVRYDDSCWCYKDYGLNHFNLAAGIEHDFDFRITAINRTGCGGGDCMYNALWVLSNTVNDLYSTDPFLSVNAVINTAEPTDYQLKIWERNAGWWTDGGTGYIFAVGTTYYAKVTITGTAFVLDVYSTANLRDIGGNGDLAHRTLTLQANYQFRYLYVFNSWDYTSGGPWTSGYGECYDIHEIVAPTVTTQAATNCAADGLSVTLNGTITATGGQNVTRGFRWGIVSGVYPFSWSDAGTHGVGPYTHIPVINCGVAYFYTAVATNCRGTSYGIEQTFICPCPPPVPPPPPPIGEPIKGKLPKPWKWEYFWGHIPSEKIRAIVERFNFGETKTIKSALSKIFAETKMIRSKITNVFSETNPITAFIMIEFIESVNKDTEFIYPFGETQYINSPIEFIFKFRSNIKVIGKVINKNPKTLEEEIEEDLEWI